MSTDFKLVEKSSEESRPSTSKLLKTKFKQCVKTKAFLVAFIVSTTIVVLAGTGAMFGISWAASGAARAANSIATDQYTPGDTRLLSFSSFFCSAVSLETQESTTASIYLVDEAPGLTENGTDVDFAVVSLLRPEEYIYWQYYLHPNSTISMIGFVGDDAEIDIYVVKGNENAARFTDFQNLGFSGISVTEERVYVRSGRPRQLLYEVTEEDEYYLVVDNYNSTSIGAVYGVSVLIQRYEYELPSTVESSTFCDTSSTLRCNLDIPYGVTSSQSVLVTLDVPANVSWTEGVNVNVDCVRRAWAYAVVIIVPLIVLMLIVALVILSIVLCCRAYQLKHLKAVHVDSY